MGSNAEGVKSSVADFEDLAVIVLLRLCSPLHHAVVTQDAADFLPSRAQRFLPRILLINCSPGPAAFAIDSLSLGRVASLCSLLRIHQVCPMEDRWWRARSPMCPTEPTVRSPRHGRIETTLLRGGRGHAVGLYVRLHWRGTAADPSALAAICGSQYSAEPAPARSLYHLRLWKSFGGDRRFGPVPSGLFHLGHVPEDRPYRRAGYVFVPVT